jgi:hypothetical protein
VNENFTHKVRLFGGDTALVAAVQSRENAVFLARTP